MKHKLQEYAKKYGYFSKDHPLIGRVTDDENDIAIAVDFLQLIDQIFQDPGQRGFARAELISKLIAYREMRVGMEIDTYKIDRVFDLWQGVPAFGLVSKTEVPLLLFRGTDMRIYRKKGAVSILSDLDPRGPGFFLFQKGREQLRAWMKDHTPRVMGHSLGGALVFYSVLFDSDLIDPVGPSYAFNAPGLYPWHLKRWKALTYSAPLVTIVAQKDPVSKLGTQVGEIVHYPNSYNPLQAHVVLMCADSGFGT